MGDFNKIINYIVDGLPAQNIISVEMNEPFKVIVILDSPAKCAKNETFKIENNDLQLFLENKVYKVVYKDYFNYVTYDNNLRGYIRGEITQTNCTPVNPTDFVIHCYRNHDHHFIGEYKIISGLYEIPNLYFNYFYDIILVDKNRNFEQKVSSNRKPILQI